MENKPLHYDGSFQISDAVESEATNKEEFQLTDDVRKNLSGNPYLTSTVE